MQQHGHYSVSIHTAFPHKAAAQPSSTNRIDDPTNLTAVSPPQNGFKSIKDAARRDFFTIRADSVQDAALSLLDSLAEYLVWDGMDRRLRAAASATHTDYPEAIVTVQQIANDIKIRVGHDLCERTIERALKKLCDVGLLSTTPRFHQGRRQASSYMLLYTPSMAARLENSRRGRVKSASTGQEPPQGKSTTAQNPDVRQYQPYGSVRIGDMISRFPMSSGLPDVPHDAEPVGSTVNTHAQPASDLTACSLKGGMKALPAAENEQPPEISETTDQHYEIDDSNHTPGGAEIQAESGVCRSAHYAASPVAPSEDQRASSHPTSMSPLFNKAVKENKKDFKNVFSISDFIKREPAKKSQTALKADPSDSETGYYLDTVHRSGWVSSPKKHLQEYFGSLSTYLFFNKYHTIEAMAEWFQQQENRINSAEITIGDVIATAGIKPKESQSDEQKITMLAQK
ncbi:MULTISPECIES: hypothetical protein [Acidithiobacillus]|uniref:Uncharacterized protein n=2 Tax=Acidithiobacillus TaxID=119977 RepID=A0A179BQ37_ACIFR|nr:MULTISPECIES: hypothetical protein [Acidithiobacillus]MEB8485915.1 hypothetical protein [Acidithiobacillus ferriphilus]MEB8489646.1 hypothetical protein [Acidithiobacillus ferriphilus]MEB8492531.1 hypothetical protein [Acidithiobacillus ferriphilus]MEB8515470.1 hypothetical protein [Acidithiobacillus ferriphilus]MEB8521454.1 hypothetical protein [Acidithiobacillus ferriphilus]